LPWRIALLVGQGNQAQDNASSSPLFSPLTTPPLWPPKREYNAVSAIADEIWQYRTGGNLTILTKITALRRKANRKSARSKVLAAKHTASLRLHVRDLASLRAEAKSTFFFKGGGSWSRS